MGKVAGGQGFWLWERSCGTISPLIFYFEVHSVPTKILLVASANGDVGMSAGMEILKFGGTALDAVEAATRMVELNEVDHTVGVGGYPNALGEMELDASIMDGSTRRIGAVAALKGFANPISVARRIMDKMPQHALLVGDGASRFAREQGFLEQNILTDDARGVWLEKVSRTPEGSMPVVESEIGKSLAARFLNEEERDLLALANRLAEPDKMAGTVNFLAIDQAGNIASAVSTSGWAFKYPGRAGDSPVIGAGNYCDSRFGACACTGLGEWAMRASTARTVILAMQFGKSLDEACRFAIDDLKSIPLPENIERVMNCVAIDKDGNHAAYSTRPGRKYVWQTAEMADYETSERTVTEV